jgi:DNA-binding transcriptional ArsR family regulator
MNVYVGNEINIIKRDVPDGANLNDLLQWYGASIGLFSPRDKDSSCFRVFITLFHDVKDGSKGLKSEEIAGQTDLSRGTVVHHLNKLRDRGIVAQADSEYFLKVDSLTEMTSLLREEVNDALDDIDSVAGRVDDHLSLR